MEGKFYTSCGFDHAPPNCHLQLQLLPRRREERLSLLPSQELELGSKRKLWLMKSGRKKKKKKKNQGRCERVLDTTFAVTLFCLTGLKLTKRISYTGRAEMWTRFSFWRVPVSPCFHGITVARGCFLIYCAKHRFISETAGCMECSTVSHTHMCLHTAYTPHFSTALNIKCLKIQIYRALHWKWRFPFYQSHFNVELLKYLLIYSMLKHETPNTRLSDCR